MGFRLPSLFVVSMEWGNELNILGVGSMKLYMYDLLLIRGLLCGQEICRAKNRVWAYYLFVADCIDIYLSTLAKEKSLSVSQWLFFHRKWPAGKNSNPFSPPTAIFSEPPHLFVRPKYWCPKTKENIATWKKHRTLGLSYMLRYVACIEPWLELCIELMACALLRL